MEEEPAVVGAPLVTMGAVRVRDEGDEGGEGMEVLRDRSKTRSFFSEPPVARSRGDGCEGKATARTM